MHVWAFPLGTQNLARYSNYSFSGVLFAVRKASLPEELLKDRKKTYRKKRKITSLGSSEDQTLPVVEAKNVGKILFLQEAALCKSKGTPRVILQQALNIPLVKSPLRTYFGKKRAAGKLSLVESHGKSKRTSARIAKAKESSSNETPTGVDYIIFIVVCDFRSDFFNRDGNFLF